MATVHIDGRLAAVLVALVMAATACGDADTTTVTADVESSSDPATPA